MHPSFEDAAMREHAHNVGRDNPDQEWILTPLDAWYRNPFYTGKPGRHPEDDYFDEDEGNFEMEYVTPPVEFDDGSNDIPF